MNRTRKLSRYLSRSILMGIAILMTCASSAQVTSVVFEDDFSSETIDASRYTEKTPFFEGGTGDIHAEPGDGVMRFVGTTTQQWWSGGTLEINQTFTATEDTPVTLSIDRVSEAGQGTASRSALWIFDETEQNYILFADVRGEGGWRYNRKIGEDGDVPTGGGTVMTDFDGDAFDDGGLHTMSMVANGDSVQLILDGQVGAEVRFPFQKVKFQFGAFARADNDTAETTWDNLSISTALATSVVFSDDFSSGEIDPAKFRPDSPFFEGGEGDIQAQAGDGVMKFVGTTTQQWWSGGTLELVPTFNATEDTPVTLNIDRVSEAGVGTASRSALWIFDETKQNYILFADVRGEGGWRYNRKIGEDGDVPTGGGTVMTDFDGDAFDDGGLHEMSMVADGSTVQLLLDGQVGAEVSFPFQKVKFQFGAFARADNDTADTTWDNISVSTVVVPTNVLFEDDFSSNEIASDRYQVSSPFFEGGVGDIHPEAGDGVMRFVGTTTQQWWSGGTLRIVPTFEPSDSETITLTIDRVSEAGDGTASRSALWILDETRQNYILFADVRGEGGWRYNRKIGQDGDVPTGGGNNLTAFDGEQFDDGGLHEMSMVANGSTVKLLLDGIEGAEVNFPFSPVIFEFGAYARANDDTANTTWDNLRIESEGGASFTPSSIGVLQNRNSQAITVRLPSGLNSQNDVSLRVVSDDPSVAVPLGGAGGSLTLDFPAGGSNEQSFRVQGISLGATQFSLQGSVSAANRLDVTVVDDPGVRLTDDFSGSLDTSAWGINRTGFAGGEGDYLVEQSGGVLNIGGFVTLSSWGGASVRTENNYVATKDLNLSFSVDRVSVDIDIGARTGVFIANADRSEFVFFSQNSGDVAENTAVWQVNVNSTGNGMNIPAFDFANGSLGRHTMEMIANGETVELLLDGVSGGKFPFEVASGIHFEIGAYSELAEAFDQVNAVFDDVQIANVLPSIEISPSSVTALINSHDNVATVTIPALLNDGQDVSVTVTSSDPGVVVPGGEAGGSLTLLFEAGAPNVQNLVLVPTGKGSATLDLSTDSEAGVKSMRVNVVSEPEEALIENFGGSSLDANRWDIDNLPFDSGVATADSSVSVVDGQLVIDVTAEESLWPGFAVFTKERFNASLENPITFEVNRTNLDFVLTTGTGSEQRTGAYVRDDNGNFVFFNDYVAHDGRNYGWRYNKQTGAPDDDPTGAGVNISAFDGGLFDNRGDHRLKMIVNGATVQLYLDDIFGAEVEFASANGLSFGIGAYVDETGNVTVGSFDNVLVLAGDSGAGPVDFVPSSGVALEWSESVLGPWIEAGTESPFAVPADSDAAFFRLNGSTEPLSISIDGGNVTVEW